MYVKRGTHLVSVTPPKPFEGISQNFNGNLVWYCSCAPPILYFDQNDFWGFPWHNMDLALYIKRGVHILYP